MRRGLYCYTIDETVEFREAEETLHHALRALEAFQGEGRVRLDARFDIDPAERTISVDAGTDLGQRFNEVLAYFLSKEIGLGGFRVNRVGFDVHVAHAPPWKVGLN